MLETTGLSRQSADHIWNTNGATQDTKRADLLVSFFDQWLINSGVDLRQDCSHEQLPFEAGVKQNKTKQTVALKQQQNKAK